MDVNQYAAQAANNHYASQMGLVGQVPTGSVETAPHEPFLSEIINRLQTVATIQYETLQTQRAHWSRVYGPEPEQASPGANAPKPPGQMTEISMMLEHLVQQARDLRSNAERAANRI